MVSENINIENSLGFALHLSSHVFKSNMKDNLNAGGINITPEEFIFLFSMPEDPTPQSVMIKKLYKDKATMTRLIDRLVAKDWIERSENIHNRREQIIQVTDTGRAVREKGMPLVLGVSNEVFEGISAEHVQIAKQVLQQIITNITKANTK